MSQSNERRREIRKQTLKKCSFCGQFLDRSNFKTPKSHYCNVCREIVEQKAIAYRLQWKKDNWDRQKLYQKRNRMKPEHKIKAAKWKRARGQIYRMRVLKHYSPDLKCIGCGFSDVRALTIDHIDGGGCAHRREIKVNHNAREFYRWIIKNNFPDGFQILCCNCQSIKRWENREGIKITYDEAVAAEKGFGTRSYVRHEVAKEGDSN